MLREGYDFFHLAGRSDVLGFSRQTVMTVTRHKGHAPTDIPHLDDVKDVLGKTAAGTTMD